MDKEYIARLISAPERSFFLFGPRGTGKSTWLKRALPEGLHLDLLDASLSLRLSRDPHLLEALVGNRPRGSWVVLDEIQKIPALLDEVHRLIEGRGWRFALCGSSARKLKRGGVNLLGGRAGTLGMEQFSAAELGALFDLAFALEWGVLPMVWGAKREAASILSAYVDTYLKEEIKEERILRKIPPFLRFLSIAGQLNGQVINAQNIARETAVPRSSVDVYFEILTDTMWGHFLPAYRPGWKVRERQHPKFYWFDPGVARAAAGLLFDPLDRLWKGVALETLIYHELRVYNEISGKHRPLSHYRTAGGGEIDFVIETKRRQTGSLPHVVCLEVKLAEEWNRGWERAMRDAASAPGVRVERMIGIYTGSRPYSFDRVDVWPAEKFLSELHRGNVI